MPRSLERTRLTARLVKTIVPGLIALATLSCAADQHPMAYRLNYHHPSGGGPNDYVMILAGADYTARDAFLAAVAKLPPRSRLTWDSGCIGFDDIPLGSAPRMSIAAFKAFCRDRGIRFDYRCGLSTAPLITKTFSVSSALAAERTDPQDWLQARGVTFPAGSSARWQPARQALAVRNTEENVDLIGLLVQTPKPR
jgi:hypothetical protein